jgi:hypothetical protein
MTTIEFARTRSVDYQSEKFGVQFTLYDGFTVEEGFELARFVVDSTLSGSYNSKRAKRLTKIYEACFDGSMSAFIAEKDETNG